MNQTQWTPSYAPLPRIPVHKRTPVLVLAVLVFLGLGYGAWALYKPFLGGAGGALTLVVAPEGPFKIRPEGVNAHEVPHKDKTIYDQLNGQVATSKEVTLREVPVAPVEAPPSLPDDFIKALSQAPITSQDLETGQGENSPFVEEDATPFAEREGFFQEQTPSFKKSGALAQEEVLAIPLTAQMRRTSLVVEGSAIVAPQGEMRMCLEFAVTPNPERATKEWQSILRRAGHLLATMSPAYVRVDHGQGEGVHYHLRVTNLTPEKAQALQTTLAKAGVHAWSLPQ
jgi:hypothetical protein